MRYNPYINPEGQLAPRRPPLGVAWSVQGCRQRRVIGGAPPRWPAPERFAFHPSCLPVALPVADVAACCNCAACHCCWLHKCMLLLLLLQCHRLPPLVTATAAALR